MLNLFGKLCKDVYKYCQGCELNGILFKFEFTKTFTSESEFFIFSISIISSSLAKETKFFEFELLRPLPRDGGMVEDHGAQKPGNSPGPGPEVVEKQRVAKEPAVQRVPCWTVQNEIKGVLGRVSASASRRIFHSANPKEIGA